jgi:GxxExxY protein
VPIDDAWTYAIIGAAMEVHRELSPGYVEAAYQRAFAIELRRRSIPFTMEVPVPLHYKGEPLGVPFRADAVVDGVLVELTALPATGSRERARVAHYLKATNLPLGLLLNFGAPSLQVERVAGASAAAPSPESQKSLESQAASSIAASPFRAKA